MDWQAWVALACVAATVGLICGGLFGGAIRRAPTMPWDYDPDGRWWGCRSCRWLNFGGGHCRHCAAPPPGGCPPHCGECGPLPLPTVRWHDDGTGTGDMLR
jgi:hypothetical protein